MYKFFTLALISLPFFASFSFAVTDDTQVLDKENVSADTLTLKSFTSCDAMDSVLVKYFKQTLLDQVSMYGNIGKPVLMEWVPTSSVDAPVDRWGIGGGWDGGGFSQTNIQIAGIDESEVVKNDGKYIYYASNQPDADGYQYVTITQAIPVQDMNLVKRIKLPKTYNNIQLYVQNKKLTILANKWNQNYVGDVSPVHVGNWSSTVVIIYDIADPVNPKLSRFYTVSGDLSQSRSDGEYLYVLSQNYVSLNTWWPIGIYGKEDINTYFDKKFSVENILPQTVDIQRTDISDKQMMIRGQKAPFSLVREKIGCSNIEYLLPERPQNLSFLTLSVIPLKWDAEVQKKVIYGDASQFFMSQDSLYIVGSYWKQGGNFSCPLDARCLMPVFRSEQNSLIHRFSTKNGKVQYQYSVLTPGMPLSQYALNEKNGILFTANQKDWTTNGVDIFAIDSSGKLLSKLENVWEKERFQSARYIDNRLYLVTFEQVDPLFVIDTTNPKNMKIMGELVMPWYSTYLHPYDENHLIGLGYDTKPSQWWGVVNGGIKVDLYDVSDISKPKQKFSQVYGGVWSSSDALWNPRSLVWDAYKHILLIPAQLMDQNQTTYQYNYAWQWLLAIKVDKNSGISQEAKISHIDMTGIAEKRKEECSKYALPVSGEKCYTHIVTGEKICLKPQDNPENQNIPTYCYAEFDDSSYLANTIWNFYGSFVQRGLYIDNSLYTVSPETIQANMYGGGYELQKSIHLSQK